MSSPDPRTPKNIARLREVLNKAKLRRSLDDVRRELMDGVRRFTGTDLIGLSTGQRMPMTGHGWMVNAFLSEGHRLYESLLEDQVVRNLDELAPVLIEDLAESFREHILVTDEQYASAYERFCVSVISKAWTAGTSDALPIATVPDPLQDFDETQTLWSVDGREVRLSRFGPWERVDNSGLPSMCNPRVVLFARVYGIGTVRAIRRFGDIVAGLLQSILRSCSIVEYCDRIELSDIETHSVLPYVVDDQWPIALPLVQDCLSIYFLLPAGKNTIHHRTRNALQLLIEADRQPNHAIGLALCFSAIEAMLSNSKTNITKSLSENAMVLLEPEVVHRQAASKFVAELYNRRSRVLHGEELNHPELLRTKSRILAAAVLIAMLQRQDFLKKCGAEAKPKEFFTELDEARITASVIPGVEASAAVKLWRD